MSGSNSRTFKGQSQEERQAERRRRLIDAGIAAFGERGYHAVTVRELCAEAKLTERYFYESFENMPTMFMAVFAEVNMQLKNEVLKAIMLAPKDPMSLAEAYLRSYFIFIRQDPKRARIIGFSALAVNPQVRMFVEKAIEDYANMVRGFMLLLYPTMAHDPRLSAEFLSHGLVGANLYMAERWIREDFRTPLEDVVATNMLLYRTLADQVKSTLATLPMADDGSGKAGQRGKSPK
ncbi:MAG: TetR/AcrR family transcriptional regulator [Myxococcales bacterium]